MPYTLRSPRLSFRPAGLRGARAFWKEVRDWPVMRSTSSWPYPLSFKHCTYMIGKAWNEPDDTWVFFAVRNGKPIGSIGLHADGRGGYWLGYMFGRDHWGQGYATEAVKEVLKFGYKNLRTKSIWAEVAVGNEGSMAVFQKNGFVQQPGSRLSYSRAHNAEVPIVRFDRPLEGVHP